MKKRIRSAWWTRFRVGTADGACGEVRLRPDETCCRQASDTYRTRSRRPSNGSRRPRARRHAGGDGAARSVDNGGFAECPDIHADRKSHARGARREAHA